MLTMFLPHTALYWLAASGLLLVFYGLVKVGIAASRMVVDPEGKFELTVLYPESYQPKSWGVKHATYRIDQAIYEKVLRLASRVLGLFALVSFLGFLIAVSSKSI